LGLQQFVEGLGFLLFADGFWMIWIPWSAWSISRSTDGRGLQNRLRSMAILATVIGIGFDLPVLFNPPAVQPARLRGQTAS
jgi:hypothetical protein